MKTVSPASSSRPERVIVLWFPGWEEVDADTPDFAPVFARLLDVVPQVEELRPGVVVMLARGPSRYYGSESRAAATLIEFACRQNIEGARVGIADGRFAAEQAAIQAAHSPGTLASGTLAPGAGSPSPDAPDPDAGQDHESLSPGVVIVPPGASADFLRELPISRISDAGLARVLPGLGIYTLGAFAALPEEAVRARFGPQGVHEHRHCRGEAAERGEAVRPTAPAQDFAVELSFDTPLTGAEQLAFACSSLTEQLSAELTASRLVCTTLRITLTDDVGVRHEREWSHPRFFTPADMLARLRWQAGVFDPNGSGSRWSESTGAGIQAVRLVPTRTDRAATHEPGLWSSGIDERVHHHVSRAQSLLGPEGVGTAILEGGRLLRDRQRFTPWGVAITPQRKPGPWPGALPQPGPTLVFTPPLRALLLDATEAIVGIDSEDLLSAPPAALRVEGHETRGGVHGWSRPWPIREHWWEGRPSRFRLQLELENGDAWVLLAQEVEGGSVRWFAEGRYD